MQFDLLSEDETENLRQIVLSNATITATGSTAVTLDPGGFNQIRMIVRINNSPTGTAPTIKFTLNNLDSSGNIVGAGTESATYNSSITTQSFTHISLSGLLQLNYTVTGTTPSFTGITVMVVAQNIDPIVGFATSALQTTGNASLASIDAGTPAALGQTTMANSMPVVLPSDQIVNVNISSITPSGQEPQSFEAYSPATAPAANKSMISILNADATKLVKIRAIYLTNVQTTAVTGVMLNFQLNRITGHSAGTLLTAFPYDTSLTLDADITVRTGSTVAGEGSTIRRWIWSSDERGVGTLDREGFDYGFQEAFPIFKQEMSTGPLVLRQNQGITLKQTISSTVGTWDINVIFTQE